MKTKEFQFKFGRMNYSFLWFLVLFILQVELCTSLNRHCQEAVDSVTIVDSCPTSKIAWDVAARKKNCGRMASKQHCTTVEKYQYHCVVNGLRSELLEVCAPTRIIFGHCVEFNVRGGVIQDHLSAPCNATFPKCANFYLSSDVYKYSDCYKLVFKNKGSFTLEEKTLTSTSKSTLNTSSGKEKGSVWTFVIISVLIIAVVAVVFFLIKYFRKPLCDSEQINRIPKKAVFSNIENGEGDVKYACNESEPSMEIEDDEITCLIPRKVEDIEYQTSDQTLSRRFSKSEPAVNNIQYRLLNQSVCQLDDQDIQYRLLNQSVCEPDDQEVRLRTSTKSMSQRSTKVRSEPVAYYSDYKVSKMML